MASSRLYSSVVFPGLLSSYLPSCHRRACFLFSTSLLPVTTLVLFLFFPFVLYRNRAVIIVNVWFHPVFFSCRVRSLQHGTNCGSSLINTPKAWWFPVPLTRENANTQFNILRSHVMLTQLFVAGLLLVGQVSVARIAEGTWPGLPEHFVPAFFLLFFLQTLHYIVSAFLHA